MQHQGKSTVYSCSYIENNTCQGGYGNDMSTWFFLKNMLLAKLICVIACVLRLSCMKSSLYHVGFWLESDIIL